MVTSLETRHKAHAVVAIIILLVRQERVNAAIFLTNGSGHIRARLSDFTTKDGWREAVEDLGRKEAVAFFANRVRSQFPTLTGPWSAALFVSQGKRNKKHRSFRLLGPVAYLPGTDE